MSADLLAGFDPYYVPPNSNNAAVPPAPAASTIDELSFFDSPQASAAPQNNSAIASSSQERQTMDALLSAPEDDFDAWGDFVTPAASPPRMPTRAPIRPPARIRAATQDFFSGKFTTLIEKSDPSEVIGRPRPVAPPSVVSRKARSPYTPEPDVLFDADNLSEDEEDDFGEFENAQSPSSPMPQQQPDLLSNEMDAVSATIQKLAMPSLPRNKAPEERNPFAEIGSSYASPVNSTATSPRVITPWPAYVGPTEAKPKKSATRRPPPQQTNWDDTTKETVPVKNIPAPMDYSWGWGDENGTPEVPQKTQATQPSAAAVDRTSSEKEEDAWGWNVEGSPVAPSKPAAKDDSPPTNVPPPTVLIAFFPDVLTSLQSSLFAPGLKQKILSNPAILGSLKAYLSIGVVAAHVIAGRKSRWKRDKLLSQSMSIGQAGAGGKSGMKLVGVDKAEAAREDREAGDFVRWWTDQVGRLRSAVAVANLTIHNHSAHLTVPEINEMMPVRTATLDEGALTAPKCCFLCGLKRDERVLKIDGQVEDSFGEWWVDYWGHRACKDFWTEQSEKLKHR